MCWTTYLVEIATKRQLPWAALGLMTMWKPHGSEVGTAGWHCVSWRRRSDYSCSTTPASSSRMKGSLRHVVARTESHERATRATRATAYGLRGMTFGAPYNSRGMFLEGAPCGVCRHATLRETCFEACIRCARCSVQDVSPAQ